MRQSFFVITLSLILTVSSCNQPDIVPFATPEPTLSPVSLSKLSNAQKFEHYHSKVLKATLPWGDAGVAYKELFTFVGPQNLHKLIEDENIGIALQAAWEVNKNPIKRPQKIKYRADWILDQQSVSQFLNIVEQRTNTQVPVWWQETLKSTDFFPGEHTAFVKQDDKLQYHPTVWLAAPEGTVVQKRLGSMRIKTSNGDILLLNSIIERAEDRSGLNDQINALIDPDQSFIALHKSAGFPYVLMSTDSKTGRLLWMSDVWATGRTMLFGLGYHNLTIKRQGNLVLLFGGESHGMYIEGFDAETGENVFRFCTCYWGNFSEKWELS